MGGGGIFNMKINIFPNNIKFHNLILSSCYLVYLFHLLTVY